MDDSSKQEDANIALAWSPETLAAFLAQPYYKGTAARSKLLEQPQEVVADLMRELQESLKDHPASDTIDAIIEKALGTTDMVIHQNTADTWNIAIPSDALLEQEDQQPALQENGALQKPAKVEFSMELAAALLAQRCREDRKFAAALRANPRAVLQEELHQQDMDPIPLPENIVLWENTPSQWHLTVPDEAAAHQVIATGDQPLSDETLENIHGGVGVKMDWDSLHPWQRAVLQPGRWKYTARNCAAGRSGGWVEIKRKPPFEGMEGW